MEGGYGHNTARWQRTTDSYAGRWAQRLTITSYHNGDAKLLPQFDLGERSLPVQAGRSYTLGAWYQSTAATPPDVTRLIIDWTLVAAAAVAGLTVAARTAQRRWPRSRPGDNPVPAEGKRVSSSSSSRLRTA
jgi:hypothetical protein